MFRLAHFRRPRRRELAHSVRRLHGCNPGFSGGGLIWGQPMVAAGVPGWPEALRRIDKAQPQASCASVGHREVQAERRSEVLVRSL